MVKTSLPLVETSRMTDTTEQETFWREDFGNDYTDRNSNLSSIASNVAFFSKILGHAQGVGSALELGSNIGLNPMALRQLLPESVLSAVEINGKAASILRRNLPEVDLFLTSILDFRPTARWDLVFMHRISLRYVLVAEYYNPTPAEVVYRGHTGKLFKRDFAGEMMDRFPDLFLAGYGFAYHRDPDFPQDDITWFLMEKR